MIRGVFDVASLHKGSSNDASITLFVANAIYKLLEFTVKNFSEEDLK